MQSNSNKNTNATNSYCLDDQIGYVLRRAFQRHTIIFLEEMPAGLTPTQFAALVRLEEVGPCSQNHLGRQTAMDVSTIKGVVDRLRRRGLVEVSADALDRRRSSVALTEAGSQLMGQARQAGSLITERTLTGLTPPEQQKLLELLNRIAK